MSDEATVVSSTPEASNEGQDTQEVSTQQPKAPKPAPKMRKIGDDFVDEATIERDYKKWKAADAKFREAAKIKSDSETFMQRLQEDPESVLNEKGLSVNKRALAEKWLLEQLEAEMNPADPRDAKLSETERRLKEYEERDAKAAKDREMQQYEAAKEQRKQAISQTLSEAMKATQLSAHPESAAAVLREMALYMRAAKERGEEVSPQELVEHVHNNRFHQMYTLAHQYEGEQLIEFLGEEIVNRIRKHDLARLKSSRNPQATHKSDSWVDSSKQQERPKTMDSFQAREHMNRLLGKK